MVYFYIFQYFNNVIFFLRSKIEIEEAEMDEILCREAIICGNFMKFKEYILKQKFILGKRSYGKSITDLIFQVHNFELLQELSKSLPIDLNFKDISLSQQTIEQLSQCIRKIEKLRSLRFSFFLSFFLSFLFFFFSSSSFRFFFFLSFLP